ncbi:hypothetical protein GCM10010182_58350 [Actinomadura cremea]|nr:hypothetical protein GCM10010182_58350 [Actinomadura cremea]
MQRLQTARDRRLPVAALPHARHDPPVRHRLAPQRNPHDPVARRQRREPRHFGPLTLALVRARRSADLLWAALAGTGVLLIYRPFGDPVSASGVAFAPGSGACMAAYLVLNKRAGTVDGAPLAWGVAVAALLALPPAPLADGAVLRPGVLAAGLGVALLSAVVPWSLDQAAPRRMPEQAVAVMVSLEPAAAALAGLVLLGERLDPAAWLAVGCVSAASAGAAFSHRRSRDDREATVPSPSPGPSDEHARTGTRGDR